MTLFYVEFALSYNRFERNIFFLRVRNNHLKASRVLVMNNTVQESLHVCNTFEITFFNHIKITIDIENIAGT